MKANKAVKRLGKIEELISDVAKRFAAHTPDIKEMLGDAKAAFERVRSAVSAKAEKSSKSKRKSGADSGKAGRRRTEKKTAAAAKKTAVKTAANPPAPKAAKKQAPVKKTVAKRPGPASKPAPGTGVSAPGVPATASSR